MANTEALEVAKAFFEVVFQRFGACEMLRHDRDPRFMGQVFTEFNKMLGQRQRATLSYRPQANGQQERSVQTVMQSVKAYISDLEQRDWDTLAESLMFALNTSYDRVRQETPFFSVHGWDARNTISAMIPSLASRKNGSPVATKWRRETICRHERAQQKAWELQRYWKKERARDHNAPRKENDNEIQVGDSVWLFINNVKPRFAKKLAHMWHGPFRVKKKVDDHSVTNLPDREGYRFHPVVHVSRLKLRRKLPERPAAKLVNTTGDRFDFDEELLPDVRRWRGEEET